MKFSKKLFINLPLFDDVAPLFMPPKFPDSIWTSIKESTNDCYKQNPCMVFKQVFSFIFKPLISILESSKDDAKKKDLNYLCYTNALFH